MSVADTIARPYAKAIFAIAIKNNNIQEWKKILIMISKIVSLKQIRPFLSGALSPKYLSLIFTKITYDIINDNEHAKNLIKLLAEYQRFQITSHILQQFLTLEAQYKNILIIEVSTAYALQETDIKKIQKILEQFFLKKIKLFCKVNPRMLGGLIIKQNDMIFDFSIENHFKQLFLSLH